MAATSIRYRPRSRLSGSNESMIGDTADAGTFANDLIDNVEKLVAKWQPYTERFAFGSLTVDLSVIGEDYRRRLTAPIDFARVADPKCHASAWRIVAVDGNASGVGAPPKLSCEMANAELRRRQLRSAEQRLMAYYDPVTLTLRVLSSRRRFAVIWTANAARTPEWEDSAPLRDLFHWMTLSSECFLAHAAAIGIGKTGVLFIGPGGSGKSTTAGAALLRGAPIAGDDFVLVDPRFAQAHALYDCIKLDSSSIAWFPDLKAEIVNRDREPTEKGRIHLFRSRPQIFVRSVPIAAAFLPRVTGLPSTEVTLASPGEALLALVPSTISLVAGGSAELFRKSAAFLRNLPVYHCNLGTNPFEVIDVMSTFIGDVAK